MQVRMHWHVRARVRDASARMHASARDARVRALVPARMKARKQARGHPSWGCASPRVKHSV